MNIKTNMSTVSNEEIQNTVGGISFATFARLSQFSNLTPIQVSALKYYNRLDDPAKFQDLMPETGIPQNDPLG